LSIGVGFLTDLKRNNMSKQTAVEWLLTQIPLGIRMNLAENGIDFQQALTMEKEQKKFMFDCGRQYQLTGEGTFTQVYNETYKDEQ
jgi:hypothetical protein